MEKSVLAPSAAVCRGDSANRVGRNPTPASEPEARPCGQPRRWQETQCPSSLCFSSGDWVLQRGNWAIGQRVWKWQPEGGRIGLGTSPCRGMRFRFTCGSGIGTAESSASV